MDLGPAKEPASQQLPLEPPASLSHRGLLPCIRQAPSPRARTLDAPTSSTRVRLVRVTCGCSPGEKTTSTDPQGSRRRGMRTPFASAVQTGQGSTIPVRGIPQLRRLAGHAKGHRDIAWLRLKIGDKVDVPVVQPPVNERHPVADMFAVEREIRRELGAQCRDELALARVERRRRGPGLFAWVHLDIVDFVLRQEQTRGRRARKVRLQWLGRAHRCGRGFPSPPIVWASCPAR